jgi:ABC-type Mn2+/Zn2+ transport system ATPase subunit
VSVTALLELERVTVTYGEEPVLDRLDLSLEEGSYYGIVGPSGAGKTTLLRTVLGLIRPVSGRVMVAGREVVPGRTPPVGFVPQIETVDWNFPVTVEEVVALGLAAGHGLWPRMTASERRDIAALLDRLGLAGLAQRHIRALSGGQQQRAFLARALIRRPPLLVLDEPTSGVDVATRQEILSLLRDINADGTGILLTTHDLNSVASRLPGIVCLNKGIVAMGTPADVFVPAVLRRTFGADMAVVEHHGYPVAIEVPDVIGDAGHHVHLHHDHSKEPV